MKRCVNCGLFGGNQKIQPKIVHSELTDTYYEIQLCVHCYDKQHITVEFGGKKKLDKQIALELLSN